jgi:hypothetical protein
MLSAAKGLWTGNAKHDYGRDRPFDIGGGIFAGVGSGRFVAFGPGSRTSRPGSLFRGRGRCWRDRPHPGQSLHRRNMVSCPGSREGRRRRRFFVALASHRQRRHGSHIGISRIAWIAHRACCPRQQKLTHRTFGYFGKARAWTGKFYKPRRNLMIAGMAFALSSPNSP